MNSSTENPPTPETFVLAGKRDDGTWEKIETAACEEGETAEDVKAFLETMAHANSRNYATMEVMSEPEFASRAAESSETAS